MLEDSGNVRGWNESLCIFVYWCLLSEAKDLRSFIELLDGYPLDEGEEIEGRYTKPTQADIDEHRNTTIVLQGVVDSFVE